MLVAEAAGARPARRVGGAGRDDRAERGALGALAASRPRAARRAPGNRSSTRSTTSTRTRSTACERLRADALFVGVAGNQTAALEAVGALVGASGRRRDGLVPSLGVRKPDPAFFERLVEIAGAPAAEVAYVGDRADNDAGPGARRGARLRPPSPRPVGEAPAHPAGSDRDRVARGAPGRVSVRRVTGAGLRIGLGVDAARVRRRACLSSSEA